MCIYALNFVDHINMDATCGSSTSALQLQEKLAKRGYAYECMLCHGYMGERRYVESQLYKNHMSELVPVSCSLCGFSAKSERERGVLKQGRGFRPHKLAEEKLKREGKEVKESQEYVCRNESPVALRDQHLRRMTLKDSQEVWLKRTKGSTSNREAETDREQGEAQVVPVWSLPVTTPLEAESQFPLPEIEDLLPEIKVDEEFNVLQQILNDEDICNRMNLPQKNRVKKL